MHARTHVHRDPRIVLSITDSNPIEPGSVLYTCKFAIASDDRRAVPLLCTNAGASDSEGNALRRRVSTARSRLVPNSHATPTDGVPIPPTPTSTPPPPSTPTATPRTGAEGAVPPLTAAGRWLVDDLGRVVILHGMNMVAKRDPFYPSAFGFADDDAAFLQAEGFNALRLGVDFRGLMPTPGVVENAYVEHLAETVATLVARGIFVLMDFHQDGFAPMFNGNGLPDWMAISDGCRIRPTPVFRWRSSRTRPAGAFENFWANREGPGGAAAELLRARRRGDRRALRRRATPCFQRLMNEVAGRDLDALRIRSRWLSRPRSCSRCIRSTTVARRRRFRQARGVEPFVLFASAWRIPRCPARTHGWRCRFIRTPGRRRRGGVVAKAVAAAERDGADLRRFGASTDPVLLNRLTAQMEQGLLPWMFWSYDENIIDLNRPPGERDQSPALAKLVAYPSRRRHADADQLRPATRAFHFAYDTTGLAVRRIDGC
jgi:endoglycosylceramidase